ncbi:MAG TPA: glycosyltransferase [Steroidobacteraceae bacterium]|nr:glycosyltransferase [Steroidobacteraceae bacterium]
MHLVGADNSAAPNPLLLPLLTRGARQRIENEVVHFSVGDTQFGVVRQSGIPVHELQLSSKRFSLFAVPELRSVIDEFKPDVLHAWGATAQLIAGRFASSGKKNAPQVWGVARTTPLAPDAGFMDKQVFGWTDAKVPKQIVYASAVAAANYRRAGWPQENGVIIAGGIDAERFKPDQAARERVRKQLELPKEAVVIGMHAPFSPEFDHTTLLKAVGELIRTNTNLYLVLSGRAMQKGNAVLSSAIGGGTLGTRTRLIGEWSDLAALFNACDVVCSSATTDSARLTLAMAMSCGVPSVGTGVGAQGEVLGNFGIAVESGSPSALQRGLSRALDMPFERRAFTLHEARKHIWQNFHMSRSIDKLHELYVQLAPEELQAALSKATGSQAAATLPPDLATFVPPPKPPPVVAPVEAQTEASAPKAVDEKTGEKRYFAVKPSAEGEWSLDAALATQMQNATSVKDLKPQDDLLEWSATDSELISSMMVEADPATVKPVVVERPKPKPAPQSPVIDAQQAEAKARAQRLMEARRAELRSTTASSQEKVSAAATKSAKA